MSGGGYNTDVGYHGLGVGYHGQQIERISRTRIPRITDRRADFTDNVTEGADITENGYHGEFIILK